MKYINLRIILVLVFVSIICSTILALGYQISYSRIKKNKEIDLENSMKKVLPSLFFKEEVKGYKDLYYAFDKDKKLLGYIFISEGQGYQDKIILIGALTKDLTSLLGIEIVESKETPGLGAKINDLDFKKQFNNLKIDKPIECLKTKKLANYQVNAISGATVSSESVVKIINNKIREIKEKFKNEK
ncbi:MAG: RnfABCDGE type electron transport complex subunit G [Candidatus Aenigmatarchaeota archaeon]